MVENPSVDLALYETNGPLLVVGRAYGLQPRLGSDPNLPFPNLGWSSPTFGFQRYACRGDAVSLELEGNPFLGPRSQRLTLNTGGRSKTVHLRAGELRRMTVPLTRQGPTCAVTFHVSPAVFMPASR